MDRIAKYKVTYPSNAEKTAMQEEKDVAAINAAGTLTSSGAKAESTGTDLSAGLSPQQGHQQLSPA